ncbi:MAG: Ig-like domain-containing protein [Candidatus Caldipriscus sp.]
MVGVLFLLNQYVRVRLESAVSDVGAIRYGSGYLVGIRGTSGNYKLLHINNLGQVIRAYSGSLSATVGGLVIDNNGKPLAYGGSSTSAFYIDLELDTIKTIPGFPLFYRAVRTLNYLYFVSYQGNTVFFFMKDSSKYWRFRLPYTITGIDVAYEDVGKKIYLLARSSDSLYIAKLNENLDLLLVKSLPISISHARIDAQRRLVAVGYRTTSDTTGVLLLDTTLNTVRHFQINSAISLSGVRLYGGKIYLYGSMGNPAIAILDTSGNRLSVVKDDSVLGNVRFLDPENGVAIYRGNFQAFFMKTNPNFLGTCGMNSATASVSPLSNPSYTTLTLPPPSDTTVSLLSLPISMSFYTPTTNTLCSSEPFTVVFTVPDSGDINVPLSANIGVWFSRAVDTTSVNNTSISITGWDGSSFRNYSFNSTCPMPNFCVLDPILNFRPNEEITVRFNSTIRDTFGNPLKPKVIVFRTQGVDTLNPVVVFTTPDSGAVNVPSNTKIAVQFSRDMDTTTINSTNVRIIGSSSGSRSFTKVCRTLSYCEINPDLSFNPGETVTVEFRSGIMALNGRNLVPRIITFTTGAQDINNPSITIIFGPDDTIRLYDRSTPIKARVSDDYGIQRVEWVINSQTYSQTYISPTNCNGNIYRNPDTSCFYIPDIPADTYKIIAYAYDYSGNFGIDSAYLIYRDTVKPYVVFTDPRDNSYGISPTPLITVVFSEGMDTAYTSDSLEIRVGSSTYPYIKYWEDLRTLKIRNTIPLPYDSTVKVVLKNYRDLSGNTMVGDSFSFRFTIISNAEVFVRILNVNPNTVYKGSSDSTYILAEVRSRYNIRGAKMVINGSVEVPMFAKDGSFDEPVETVYVRYRFGEFEVGEYNVSVKAWNDYVERSSGPFIIKVKSIEFLDKENVVIYPNPAKGQAKLRVIFGANTNAMIEVFDLKVKRVYYREGSFDGFKTYEFDLPKLPTGLYLVRIRAGDKKVEKWFSVIK